jgi:NAD(P)H-hydrate repair Nnr-like enzyme with NAD(P)H-hydrate epimerase domain
LKSACLGSTIRKGLAVGEAAAAVAAEVAILAGVGVDGGDAVLVVAAKVWPALRNSYICAFSSQKMYLLKGVQDLALLPQT